MEYTIDYNVSLKSGTLYNKRIKVKNKENELYAKCALEDYLRRKYGSEYINLTVTNCNSDFMSNLFNLFG